MKVLIVHNYYQSSSPSGEDMVFKNEANLLRSNGIAVVIYSRHNDEILNHNLLTKLKLASENIWSKKTYKELKDLIKRGKPDIAHFHNIFYLISPSAYYACKEMGIPVVQTLHNYRFFCINGLLMRDGKVCQGCLSKSSYYGAIRSCYRKSIIYSLPLSYMINYHQKTETWCKMIDGYIALTEFSKRKFIEFGLPEDKMFIKPNFATNYISTVKSHNNTAIYVGRFSQEKGIEVLTKAYKKLKGKITNMQVKLIGAGPLFSKIEEYSGDSFKFLGQRNHDEVLKNFSNSCFAILPSIWYEMFPMVIVESFACGKAVVASRIGALPELIEDGKTGLLFEPGNANDLASKMGWMFKHKDKCVQMGKNARRVFEEKYTAEKNFEILMNIYITVLDRYRKQEEYHG